MLIWHEIANNALADDLHTLGDTDFFLDELLAFVPFRQFCQRVGHCQLSGRGIGRAGARTRIRVKRRGRPEF
ncbi:hypothetical protein [Rhizobium leguminosarum]|uniref:hypothetical protein n=1 Tax=Rhizobium leguminosarum TaxID=384 RepID=UPI001953AE3C|nr:hypothetical protein [Rhizobium leguminosarum]